MVMILLQLLKMMMVMFEAFALSRDDLHLWSAQSPKECCSRSSGWEGWWRSLTQVHLTKNRWVQLNDQFFVHQILEMIQTKKFNCFHLFVGNQNKPEWWRYSILEALPLSEIIQTNLKKRFFLLKVKTWTWWQLLSSDSYESNDVNVTILMTDDRNGCKYLIPQENHETSTFHRRRNHLSNWSW